MAGGESPSTKSSLSFPITTRLGRRPFERPWRTSLFQAQIIAARLATKAEDRRARALRLRDDYHIGGPIQKAVALELLYTLRDCTDWPTVLAFINGLPPEPRGSPLVIEQSALALSESGDDDSAIGALRELIKTQGDTSERRGLLGGRYRRKWRDTGNLIDLDHARFSG